MVTLTYRRYSGCIVSPKEDLRKPQPRVVLDHHITDETKMTYVDFIPAFCKRINDEKAIYHSFSSLLSLANEWLHKNPDWKVVNCETVTQYIHSVIDEVDYSAIVRTLRVWIKRCLDPYTSRRETDLFFWHKDYKPLRTDTFTTLDQIIEKINRDAARGGIKGPVINMETIRCKATDNWLFNPQVTYVNKGVKKKDIDEYLNMVFVIRVYYEVGPIDNLFEVGLKDFVPQNLDPENRANEFSEKFSSVFRRASDWIGQNPDIRFCNAQSVDTYVTDSEPSVNTTAMSRTREENESEIRFVRVYFTKDTGRKSPQHKSPRHQTGNVLKPLFVASTSIPQKKSYAQLNKWYSDNVLSPDGKQFRLLSLETVTLPPYVNDENGVQFLNAVDEIYRCNRLKGKYRYAFLAIRLYYDEGTNESEEASNDNQNNNQQLKPIIEYE